MSTAGVRVRLRPAVGMAVPQVHAFDTLHNVCVFLFDPLGLQFHRECYVVLVPPLHSRLRWGTPRAIPAPDNPSRLRSPTADGASLPTSHLKTDSTWRSRKMGRTSGTCRNTTFAHSCARRSNTCWPRAHQT